MGSHLRRVTAAALCLAATWVAGACGTSEDDVGRDYFDRCETDIPSDQCYRARRDPESAQIAEAEAIAQRYMEAHSPEQELFDWTSGVFMFALTELHRVTGKTEYREYYKAYLDFHIDEGYRIVWSDSCPPALTALALLRESENAGYRQVIDDVLVYLRDEAPRTDDGGISHLGPLLTGATGIWIDSLFMFGMVLTRHGEAAGDTEALQMMSEQLAIFSAVLQHEDGLFQHADQWVLPFDTDVYWARGNAWVTASVADYLRVRFLRGSRDSEAERIFRRQIEGVLGTRDADSHMWRTVVNRPADNGNYVETSAAALFAYGIARAYRYGLLDEAAKETAKEIVESIVSSAVVRDAQGHRLVTKISEGTEPSTFEGYVSVPLRNDLNYGVGAVILALIETSGL